MTASIAQAETCSGASSAPTTQGSAAPTRKRWSVAEVEALFALPFNDLLFRAQQVHRENFDPNAVQRSTLLSIKTGGCSEDCGYCSQSSRYDTGLEKEALLPLDEVLENARAAKAKGASRFCMGAAWRGPKEKDLAPVLDMVREVKKLGLETCVTLGMLKEGQAEKLKDAGLDYYNHNIDTSPEFYGQIITTHTLQDRLDTLDKVRDAGINVCCGGIVGLGETKKSRAALIAELANVNVITSNCPDYAISDGEWTLITGTGDRLAARLGMDAATYDKTYYAPAFKLLDDPGACDRIGPTAKPMIQRLIGMGGDTKALTQSQ